MMKIMDLVDKSCKMTPEEFKKQSMRCFDCHFSNVKYVKQCCQYIDQRSQVSFILGEITLLDFFFMECSNYMLGIYNHPDRVDKKQLEGMCIFSARASQKPNVYYLGVIQSYFKMMKNQPWYLKHKDYLESFSMVCKLMHDERKKGLKKIWLGDPKMIAF